MPEYGVMTTPPSLELVALDDEATEAAAERLAVGGRRLGAEAVLELVVGVVGRRGLGEDVADSARPT